jgi:DNA topoisomerase VI subunit A
LKINSRKFDSEEIAIPPNSIIIEELDRKEVLNRINSLFDRIITQIDNGSCPYLEIPLRRRENIVYNDHWNLFLGKLVERIELGDIHNKFIQILRIAEIVKSILEKDVYATKREIYYNDTYLFKDQRFSDRDIQNLSNLLGIRRKCLNIVASTKGACIGRLKIRDTTTGYLIDLEKLGTGGWSISPFLDRLEILESDAEFILVCEKDSALIRLSELGFWKEIPCILVTGKGMPDLATREFLKNLVSKFHIPIFGLADSDPYGLEIMLTYSLGSVATASETPWTVLNNFYWLGLFPDEVAQIPKKCHLKASKMDLLKAQEMIKRPYIRKHEKIMKLLNKFLELGKKAEIHSLATYEPDYLTKYIVEKIETDQLIKI